GTPGAGGTAGGAASDCDPGAAGAPGVAPGRPGRMSPPPNSPARQAPNRATTITTTMAISHQGVPLEEGGRRGVIDWAPGLREGTPTVMAAGTASSAFGAGRRALRGRATAAAVARPRSRCPHILAG